MKLKLRAKLILCGIMSIVTVGVLGVFSHSVHAETKDKYSLSISPLYQQMNEMKPGGTYSRKFLVINSGSEEMDFNVYATGYQVVDESYTNSTYNDTNMTKVSKWISFEPSKGRLKSGETIEVEFTIKVPSDAAGGGQYASIMVETSAGSSDDSTIGATGRLSMPLYSHISGNIVTCTNILSSNLNTFLLAPPITGSALVENCGNIDLTAEYILQVYPLFSDEEVYTNEEKPDKFIILPDTKRFSSTSWENSAAFGIYRVKHTVRIADQTQSIERLVVICPIWLIVIIILFIGAVVFWLISRRRERQEAAAGRSAATGHKETEKKDSDKGSDKE